ncbi:UNVERIFIED_CONTAM: hypothetical protein Sradi_1767000 [Sesamum radiatum]|uniref:Reverse transcriptase/retrotransposon-derived protein RNase H-like domain-containing protein n=1 Tax=Sesamum radiatum TaxID=300843 RepID=A0AAW2TY52_SESRA
MSKALETLMVEFLKGNADLFAWSPADFRGIDPEVIVHRLNVDPSVRPIKQRKRSFGAERNRVIEEEVSKLMEGGAIYQRLVNKMFRNQVGTTMEVYVDDMLVKSRRKDDHLGDLKQAFDVMRAYGMKLNPSKCTFGVCGGKFLGYMVSERGIEANPEKIEAISQLKSPRSLKEVQKLTAKEFEWTEECEQALQNLKSYLATPPLLANPKQGETLFLYLAVSEQAVSTVLVRESEKVQNPVYYVSKMLQGAEKRYTQIEKLALALVITARKIEAVLSIP